MVVTDGETEPYLLTLKDNVLVYPTDLGSGRRLSIDYQTFAEWTDTGIVTHAQVFQISNVITIVLIINNQEMVIIRRTTSSNTVQFDRSAGGSYILNEIDHLKGAISEDGNLILIANSQVENGIELNMITLVQNDDGTMSLQQV